MHVTPEVVAGLYAEVRMLVDDARMACKDRVVRLRQVLEDVLQERSVIVIWGQLVIRWTSGK